MLFFWFPSRSDFTNIHWVHGDFELLITWMEVEELNYLSYIPLAIKWYFNTIAKKENKIEKCKSFKSFHA